MLKRWFKNVIADSFRVAAIGTFLTIAATLMMVHVWNQYQILNIGYEIAEVTTQHQRLLEENKKLAIEAAVVGRTERLSNVAVERYGLVPVQPEQVRPLVFEVAQEDPAVIVNEEPVALAN